MPCIHLCWTLTQQERGLTSDVNGKLLDTEAYFGFSQNRHFQEPPGSGGWLLKEGARVGNGHSVGLGDRQQRRREWVLGTGAPSTPQLPCCPVLHSAEVTL